MSWVAQFVQLLLEHSEQIVMAGSVAAAYAKRDVLIDITIDVL